MFYTKSEIVILYLKYQEGKKLKKTLRLNKSDVVIIIDHSTCIYPDTKGKKVTRINGPFLDLYHLVDDTNWI